LEYFMAILYNLWPFGLVVVNWHIFFLFWPMSGPLKLVYFMAV
jgi:hypothetical protein